MKVKARREFCRLDGEQRAYQDKPRRRRGEMRKGLLANSQIILNLRVGMAVICKPLN
jgi:hypothetical protein